MTKTIGILGMPDNETTPLLIQGLQEQGVKIDFVVYWKPSTKDQYLRLKKKLKLAGLIPMLGRIYYALIKSKFKKKHCQINHNFISHNSILTNNIRKHYVPNHNSEECLKALKQEKVDILILATDAIIRKKILEIPSIATLNGHPGWVPMFRGLGSNFFQLEKGYFPAISVHQVDEGIDTGPLFQRRYLEINPKQKLSKITQELQDFKYVVLADVIKQISNNKIKYIDTFTEQSNMTRGMSLKRQKILEEKLINGSIKLTPPPNA